LKLISKGVASALFAGFMAAPAMASWTGTYVGLYAGQAQTEAELNAALPNLSFDGATVGVLAGAMFAAGPIALGVEGDLNYIDGSSDVGCSLGSFSCEVSMDFAGSVRVRAGVPLGPVLAYATAGVAFRNITSSSEGIIPTEDDEFLTGWTAGAGAEAAILGQVRIGVEYRHYEFGAGNDLASISLPNEYDFTADEIHVRLMIPLS
jgi:outer membrane immunogenic protein